MDQTTPDTPKPNRRRAVVVTTVFAIVLGGIFYSLWTNHAYLKWRFIGGEVGLMDDCFATGYLSPDQVVTLVGYGATTEVRSTALWLVSGSENFESPWDNTIAQAIRRFAAKLPEDGTGRLRAAHAIAWAVAKSRRPELVEVLEAFAAHPAAEIRSQVAVAFWDESEFDRRGWETLLYLYLGSDDAFDRVRSAMRSRACERPPKWAAPVIHGLLHDADRSVTRSAVTAAGRIMGSGRDAELLSSRLREILDSPGENEWVRVSVLGVLYRNGKIKDEELAAFASCSSEHLAKEARKLIKMRQTEPESHSPHD